MVLHFAGHQRLRGGSVAGTAAALGGKLHRLPTVSRVDLLVFVLEQRRYALTLGSVVRVLRRPAVVPLPRAPGIVLGVLDLAGEWVPVLDVRQRFGLPPQRPRAADHLVLARARERLVGLPVDQVEGMETLPAEQVADPGQWVPGLESVRGLTRTTNGDTVIIHDLDAFLSLHEEAQLGAALAREDHS